MVQGSTKKPIIKDKPTKKLPYNEVVKHCIKGKRGKILIDSLPKEYREKHKKVSQRYKDRLNRAKLKNLDPKIYLNKYYPWCYIKDEPSVYLQGFYDLEYAKRKYLLTYGANALKYIRFIKGKEALARNFRIGTMLYIGNEWRRPSSKMYYPPEVYLNNNFKTFAINILKDLPKHNPREAERIMVEKLSIYMYGRKVPRKLNAVERATIEDKKLLIKNP